MKPHEDEELTYKKKECTSSEKENIKPKNGGGNARFDSDDQEQVLWEIKD